MEIACSIPVNYDGYIRAKERTETMHQRRLGLNIEQHLLIKGQLSLKQKTTVEEKITTMVYKLCTLRYNYKRCTLRIQAKTKTILKRALKAE